MCFTNWMRQILSITNGKADSFSVIPGKEIFREMLFFFYLEDLQPLASVPFGLLIPFVFSLDFELYG